MTLTLNFTSFQPSHRHLQNKWGLKTGFHIMCFIPVYCWETVDYFARGHAAWQHIECLYWFLPNFLVCDEGRMERPTRGIHDPFMSQHPRYLYVPASSTHLSPDEGRMEGPTRGIHDTFKSLYFFWLDQHRSCMYAYVSVVYMSVSACTYLYYMNVHVCVCVGVHIHTHTHTYINK